MTIVDTISGSEMADVLRNCGFSPEVRTDGDGDPVVLYEVLGLTTQVLFYGCENGRASSIQFMVRFADELPLEQLNTFNEDRRFIRCYSQSDGRTVVKLDCPLRGGVTFDHVVHFAELWQAAMEKFVG
jgi:hypothetical protein